MARIIEKADGTLVLFVHLTLKPGRDDPIIQLLFKAPRGALAGLVREMLRTGIEPAEAERRMGVEEQPFDLPDLGTEL